MSGTTNGQRRRTAKITEPRSNAVQEIISRKQGFLRQWSLLIFFVMLTLLTATTWFIRYPDSVTANAILSAENGPKEIVPRQDGKIIRLFARNDQTVSEGQPIAWIESNVDHAQALRLSAILDTASQLLEQNQSEKVSSLFAIPFTNLGDIQTGYQQFMLSYQQFNDYLVDGYYRKKKLALLADKQYLLKMNGVLTREQELITQDFQLTQETFTANDTLFRENVISKQDVRDEKSKLLNKQLGIPQLQALILSNENQQAAKDKDILDLEHAIEQQKLIFQQALLTLKSIVIDWKSRFIIYAPADGKIVFMTPIQQKKYIQAGKTIGYINPLKSSYYAEVTLPQVNFGKVMTGQKVQLRFSAYPAEQYGIVEGRLNYISRISSDSGFLAYIDLPHGLRTTYGQEVQYRSGLTSEAIILTKDLNLLQRFYFDIKKNLKH